MKYNIKSISTKHDNNCWCNAISLLTNKDYDEVYDTLKGLLYECGSLSSQITKGYLATNGYDIIDVDLSLWDALQVYNNKNGIIFSVCSEEDNINKHVVYVKDNAIYENIQKEELIHYIYQYKVDYIALKIKSTYNGKEV